MSAKRQETTLFIIVGLVLLLFSLALMVFWIQRDLKVEPNFKQESPQHLGFTECSKLKNLETPYSVVCQETFTISGGEKGLFEKIVFKPFVVKPGSAQKVTVVLSQPGSISNFQATLRDGKGKRIKKFDLVKKTEAEKGVYRLSWRPQKIDYGQTYPIDFSYTTKQGKKNETTLFWHTLVKEKSRTGFFNVLVRDALAGSGFQCSDSHKGSITLTADQYIASGDTIGVNNGNITVDSGVTLQMDSNSTLKWEDGYSIYPKGQIAKAAATIKKGCVHLTCDELGRDCGSENDGCGKTVSCGGCSGNTSCGYGDCADDETPNWSCDSGSCGYSCSYDSDCDCSCGGWSDDGCGDGSCSSEEMRQTRDCDPNGCADEDRCVNDSDCGGGSDCNCGAWTGAGCGGNDCDSDERYWTRDCYPAGCDTEGKCHYASGNCSGGDEGCCWVIDNQCCSDSGDSDSCCQWECDGYTCDGSKSCDNLVCDSGHCTCE